MKREESASFTAASVFPAKLLGMKFKDGIIPPVHVQLNPTNICNLNCPFCSCANRNKTESLPLEKAKEIMVSFKVLGCESVTITGGGEPLLHPEIDELLEMIHNMSIEIGLVTNGTAFDKVKPKNLNKLIWCRISHADHRPFTKEYQKSLGDAILKAQGVDWAFSYVIGKNPNYDTLQKVIEFANFYEFTHVRIVSDLLDLRHCPDIFAVEEEMKKRGVDDRIVIYQGRKRFLRGCKDCWISLLKPVVSATGELFPCCATQYTTFEPELDYGPKMKWGDSKDIVKIWKDQIPFDGSKRCVRCYYMDYNKALSIMKTPLKHKKFL